MTRPLYILIFSGTCTIIKGPGGDSCAYFVRSFFPGFPYFVIVFCYVKIIRSVKATRRISHIIQNSVKSRKKTGEQSSRETTRMTNKQILYFKTDDKDLQQTTIKGQKICRLKHSTEPASDNASSDANIAISTVQLQLVRLYNMEKIRDRKKQEEHLTMTVGG